MTVCIAARCEGGAVCVAADRMITSAGDTEYETVATKIDYLAPFIITMGAGYNPLHEEILQELKKNVMQRINAQKHNMYSLKETAFLYAHLHNIAKRVRAENHFLTPLGLNAETFITKQREMAPEIVTQITNSMITYNYCQPVQTIIAGVDLEGSHIYLVNGEMVDCLDSGGFAAIGSGWKHASTLFMDWKHHINSSRSETLFLTYAAKKKSEAAPGVGKETDIVLVRPHLGDMLRLDGNAINKLDTLYLKMDRVVKEFVLTPEVTMELNRYIDEPINPSMAQ